MKNFAQNATALISKNIPERLRPETLSLESRTGKKVDVSLKFLHYNDQYYVVLWSDCVCTTRQLEKSAENIVHQVVEALDIDPEKTTFLLIQEGNTFAFWRWRFQWVGNSPLHPVFKDLNISAQKQLFKSVFTEGKVMSLLKAKLSRIR